jgi:hypothetical protein
MPLLQRLEMPYERVMTQLRLGQVLATIGDRKAAVQRLVEAYRSARKLHARPLAHRAAHELVLLGEPVERRLGRGASPSWSPVDSHNASSRSSAWSPSAAPTRRSAATCS